MLRPFAVWALIIAAGLALLYVRFDWSVEDGRYAERGFVLSAYLFALTLPTSYYLARRILRSDPAAAAILTAAIFVGDDAPVEAARARRSSPTTATARATSRSTRCRCRRRSSSSRAGRCASFPYD